MVQISILKPIQIQLRVIILKKYDVAAYVWPAYTGDEGRSLIFWPEGYGEWETVRMKRHGLKGINGRESRCGVICNQTTFTDTAIWKPLRVYLKNPIVNGWRM